MRTRAKQYAAILTLAIAMTLGVHAAAADEYLLAPGDVIRITVFRNPDLTTEARVSGTGLVSFPLLGDVEVGGTSIPAAEKRIADGLREGGFVLSPQVNILATEVRGNQVSVLGEVGKPGRYPLEGSTVRVADMLAQAGGVTADGDDTVIVTGERDGNSFREEIGLVELFSQDPDANQQLQGGDIVFVARAPTFYIYGEVQKPGMYRLGKGTSLMEALAIGGGLTPRGTERGLEIRRRNGSGQVDVLSPALNALLRPNDVVYVKESLF
jgi:polysaccharide export outer membrane protein